MKLKPHSIRFKFFSAISLVALMFIGILLLLNLFFYLIYIQTHELPLHLLIKERS